jgi:hypothetical protein
LVKLAIIIEEKIKTFDDETKTKKIHGHKASTAKDS